MKPSENILFLTEKLLKYIFYILYTDQLLLTTAQPVTATKVGSGYVVSNESSEQNVWTQLEEVRKAAS